MKTTSDTKRVLITGARAPVALHLGRLMRAAGHQVWLGDCVKHPISVHTPTVANYYRFAPLAEDSASAGRDLVRWLDDTGIEMVIPTCEEVLHLGAIWQHARPKASLFAPHFQTLVQAHNKYRFVQLCNQLGLAAPATHLLQHPRDLKKFDVPEAWVFKPVWSRFATRVLIRPNAAQLRRLSPSPDAPWIAQEALSGSEICAYAIAREGRLVALSSYTGLVRAGQGASVCFDPIKCGAIRDFVEAFVLGTGWTGQISFDFIRAENGDLVPIECNPRATSGLHFFADADRFSDALVGSGEAIEPDIHRPQGVRMALWLYGLPMLFGAQRRSVLRAFREVEDVMSSQHDSIGWGKQLWSAAEFAKIALRERISLQSASTWGIEWNGQSSNS